MTKLLILLYIIVLCAVYPFNIAHSYGPDVAGPPCNYNWIIQNKCTEEIYLAVHYMTCDDQVVSEGWWSVRPQGEIMIRMNGNYVSYLAFSQSQNFWWYDPNGTQVGLDFTRNYKFPGDGKQHSNIVQTFRTIDVMKEHITPLGCE